MIRITNLNLLFFSSTLAADDYNDVRLGGHGTLHGYSNCVNPFLEVIHLVVHAYVSIVSLSLPLSRFLIPVKVWNTCRAM